MIQEGEVLLTTMEFAHHGDDQKYYMTYSIDKDKKTTLFVRIVNSTTGESIKLPFIPELYTTIGNTLINRVCEVAIGKDWEKRYKWDEQFDYDKNGTRIAK